MSLEEGLLVKKLVYGGYGLAEKDGRVLLIEYAIPGEVVEVQILQEKKDYSLATVKRVILPSSIRRDPPCPYFGVCGGCQLQHMEYGAQVKAKEEILLETLRRIGKLEIRALEPSVTSQELGYRIKLQFKVSEGKVGFFERRSHRLVEIKSCPVAHPAVNELLPALRELAGRLPYLTEVHVIYSPTEKEFLLKLFSQKAVAREKLLKVLEHTLPKEVVGTGFYMDQRLYGTGRDFTFIRVGPYRYRVSAESFLQINYTLWEDFIRYALPEGSFKRVLELHCGIGFFSLFLAQRAEFVVACDANGSAIRDAEYSARINSVGNVSFLHESGLEALKRHAGQIIDLLFLDPPRSGLSEGEARLIVKNKPKRIVYVSCEPTTLARDLKVLVKGGYKIESVRMVDNFPNTYHIEAVAHLVLE